MYMSGASGILLGKPIAPERCIAQKMEVVPASRISTYSIRSSSNDVEDHRDRDQASPLDLCATPSEVGTLSITLLSTTERDGVG